MNFKEYTILLEEKIKNKHIQALFIKLCRMAFNDGVDIQLQLPGIERLIDLLSLFNNFTQNKDRLLNMRDNIYNIANRGSNLNKNVFDYGAALNGIIMHYDKSDQLYSDVKIGVKESLKALKKRQLFLKTKAENHEQGSSLGKRKHHIFFEKRTNFLLNNTSKSTSDSDDHKASTSKSHKSE